MKYKVLRDNYGYRGGYYTKDQILELPEDPKIPHHFARIDGNGNPLQADLDRDAKEGHGNRGSQPPATLPPTHTLPLPNDLHLNPGQSLDEQITQPVQNVRPLNPTNPRTVPADTRQPVAPASSAPRGQVPPPAVKPGIAKK